MKEAAGEAAYWLADVAARFGRVRFYPENRQIRARSRCRLCANSKHHRVHFVTAMSAGRFGMVRLAAASFNHLVGDLLKMQWNVQPERFGGLEV